MKLGYILHLASSNLRTRKLRTFLTVGGMAIGIGAIVFLVSLGFGLQKLIVGRITNVQALTVLDVSTGASAILKIDDEVLGSFKKIQNVVGVSPSMSQSGQVVKGQSVTDAALFGSESQYLGIEGIVVSFGTVYTDTQKNTAVASTTLAELIGIKNPKDLIDQQVTLRVVVPSTDTTVTQGTKQADESAIQTKDIEVTIAGIFPGDSSLMYLPINFFKDLGFTTFNLAHVKIDDREHLAGARSIIEEQGYQVDSVADTVGQIDRIFVVFQFLMGAFGLVAMLVASLGTFNTLTVSLLERTREVGIMKSLGTTSKDIYFLFLSESLLIGSLGGFCGIILGYGLGQGVNIAINTLASKLGGSQVNIFYLPIGFLALIIGIILLVGLVTGFYPARRASKINVLDALRYE